MIESVDVVVVGSCMIDLVCYAPRLPKSGETLLGTSFAMGFGGKGCNQCVAAKKLGATSVLVARIGNDSFGRDYFEKLLDYKIPTTSVKVTDNVSTGMAQITVANTGENHIVIVPGANTKLSENDVEEARTIISNCSVLLCQLEVAENTTIKALKIKAESKKGKSIFNAAPASSSLNPLLFTLPDIFCVNETEAEILTNIKVTSTKEAEEAVAKLISKGCKEVIVTLGEKGAVYGKKGCTEFEIIKALKVNAIDTTGAGDAFVGALAFYLSRNPKAPMRELIEKACMAASISVQKLGTQESFPLISDLPPTMTSNIPKAANSA